MNGKDILRWVAVLPASAIAASLSFIILLIITLIGDLFSGEIWLYLKEPNVISIDHLFVSLMLYAVFGYVFVYAGTAISPKYKRAVAFVLFAIIAITVGFVMILAFLASHFTDSWRFLIGLLLCIIAAGVSAFNAEENNTIIT